MAQFPSIINSGSLIFAPKDISPTSQGELFFCTSDQNLYYICQCLTTWTAASSMNVGGENIWGSGTQNAGLAFGGDPNSDSTEEYDGSTWTTGGALSTARCGLAGHGAQNSALAIGGVTPTTTTATECYNGTSWNAGANYPLSIRDHASSGTTATGFAAGGDNTPGGVVGNAYSYDDSVAFLVCTLT